jgi:hypothetical protein
MVAETYTFELFTLPSKPPIETREVNCRALGAELDFAMPFCPEGHQATTRM